MRWQTSLAISRWLRRMGGACFSLPGERSLPVRAALGCTRQSLMTRDTIGGRGESLRTAFFLLLIGAAVAADHSTLVDRVGTTGFVQLEAESFKTLTLKEQTLAYWLTQASIAIDPINYDQNSIWGLRQKALLEEILRHGEGTNPQALGKITDFTKLFWANRGNHNEMTAQKLLPEFTFEELRTAALQAARNGGFKGKKQSELQAELNALKASLFDAGLEPTITANSPQGNRAILDR